MSVIAFTSAACANMEETSTNYVADIERLRNGEITPEELLEHCLDGADPDRVQGWRDYVDAIVRFAKVAKIKINVYRSRNGAWCFAMWIDGDYDCSDTLDVADDASEAEAMACANVMPLAIAGKRIVVRVDDC